MFAAACGLGAALVAWQPRFAAKQLQPAE
jgi:hypothetical protein